MHVYVLDEENELDLEMKVNDILSNFKFHLKQHLS